MAINCDEGGSRNESTYITARYPDLLIWSEMSFYVMDGIYLKVYVDI